jgi:hypothetical protein
MTAAKPAPTIYRKLMEARTAFHEIKLVKTGHNKFNDSRYFKLEDFMPHALKCLDKSGLFPLVSFNTDFATMEIFDIVDGFSVRITSPMSSANLKNCHEVQNLGAVETYERRYLWMTLMEVQEGDPVEDIPAQSEFASDEQLAALWEYHETEHMTDGQKIWLEKANDKITSDQAVKALAALKKVEAGEDV